MDIEEAKAWLRGGERSMINLIPTDPIETWELRIAQTDAAMVQQAYHMLKAHAEGLVVTKAGNQHEIYCFNNGGKCGWMKAMAIGDDGHVVATHICTNESFMLQDLGITSTCRHDKYDEHFGKGNWKLVWLSDPHDPRLVKAMELNEKLKQEGKL